MEALACYGSFHGYRSPMAGIQRVYAHSLKVAAESVALTLVFQAREVSAVAPMILELSAADYLLILVVRFLIVPGEVCSSC